MPVYTDPHMNQLGHFNFRAQRVIPMTFDDSLDYLEVLTHLQHKLNEVIDRFNYLVDWLNGILLQPVSPEEVDRLWFAGCCDECEDDCPHHPLDEIAARCDEFGCCCIQVPPQCECGEDDYPL